MKKLLSALLAVVMLFAFAACGGDKGGGEKAADDIFAKYNVDKASTEEQPMCEEKATVEVLAETAKDWLGGSTMFPTEDSKKTLDEFIEHIGVDPTAYSYNETAQKMTFIWRAADNDTAWLAADFEDADGVLKLSASGSANLNIVK